MLSMNYFLLPDARRDIIVHGPTGLRLNVYSLENEDFRPAKGELHVFGDDHGEWMAFETEGWNGGDTQIFSNAVLWYAVYLDYPFMEITTDDPRPEYRLKKIE
ncbi:hypothetical protein [Mucilaginibacter polytrichastri]|uniref:hypothetical protein n=1 Tax=Mucilaginibacter polytrichastri TaxID=1302689 RepID=UPI0008E8F0F8|nr:hypothetical protein [Mucilaginibacter polytrichastri]SFT09307.1 hypothetical protein SAMN04487890_110104 [Mucilaginibacter polytrichastri]